MTARILQFIKSGAVVRYLRHLSEPSHVVADAAVRQRLTLLLTMNALLTLCCGVLLVVLFSLYVLNIVRVSEEFLLSLAISVAIMIVIMLVSRRLASYVPFYVGGGMLFAVLLINSALHGGIAFLILMNYGSIFTLAAAQFLSLRRAVQIAVTYIGLAIVLLALLRPSVEPTMMVRALMFNVLLCMSILIITWFRERRETDRHTAVEATALALQERTEMLQAVLDYSPDAIGLLSREGRVLFNNPASALLRESPTGKRVEEMELTDAFLAQFREEFGGVLREKKPRIYITPRLASTIYHEFEVRMTPILDPHGDVISVLTTARDVTEQRRAEAQRVRDAIERERSVFFKSFVEALSHDFRTALSSIEINRYMIERLSAEAGDAKFQPKLQAVAHSINHMQRQLDNLSTISNLGRHPRTAVDLSHLVDTFSDFAREKLDAAGLVLHVEHRAPAALCLCDASELRTALTHLLENAITYSQAGQTIEVTTFSDEMHGCISLRDHGIGIDSAHLPHVFELFYRGDSARSLYTGGVGIGLSIARMIVEAHSGALTVESEPNQGSTFTLWLPLYSNGEHKG